MYSNFGNYNITRDWNKSQGTSHPTDLSTQILRDYSLRPIDIQNSGTRPIGVAITNYLSGPTPPIRILLNGGEIRHVGINSQGGPPQFLWILDAYSGKPVGAPTCLRSNSNSFVLRDGVNKWWVDFFHYPSYRAAF